MEDGLKAWQEAGYPVVAAPDQEPTSTPSVYRTQLGLSVGDTAIDFRLRDLNGSEISFFELLADKPVMLEFGAYT